MAENPSHANPTDLSAKAVFKSALGLMKSHMRCSDDMIL
jgi:hypothetical protein